jgi:glycosyltransferase involved in cell wall biosynthesis
MRASIVIRTLNEERYLAAVLRAIEGQDLLCNDRETIIVDSGSTDGTLQAAERCSCTLLHISREEFSFGRSLNRGCHAARGEVLVFLSGHCVPKDREWLEKLISPIESGEASITYGRQIGGPHTKFSEHQVFAKYFPEKDRFSEIPFFCNNANAAVSASLWKRHLFAEDLTGLEDMEFAKRTCLGQDARVEYVPGAVVYHNHHETWRQVKRRYEREALALQQIMPELHFTGFDAIKCFLFGLGADFGEMRLGHLAPRTLSEICAFRFCQFYGAWRGYHLHREVTKERKQKYFYPTKRS